MYTVLTTKLNSNFYMSEFYLNIKLKKINYDRFINV